MRVRFFSSVLRFGLVFVPFPFQHCEQFAFIGKLCVLRGGGGGCYAVTIINVVISVLSSSFFFFSLQFLYHLP